MTVKIAYPHIKEQDGEPARLAQHPRVRVAQIAMDYLAHGWSVEEMCRQHPYLQPAEVHAAMAYYFDHQQMIDEEIRQELAEVDRLRAASGQSPFASRFRAKGLL